MIRKSAIAILASAALAATVVLGVSIAAPQTPTAAPAAGWAQLNSDMSLDPNVKLGMLPNGMRYVIHFDQAQYGRAAMRFVIKAGSMQEAPDQEGLAHFLEHMAFDGSKNVPDGEMQKSLERLGLRMGADTNAATGPDRTVFMFNLAHTDEASLDTSLMLFREIASELTLDPAAADKERGVVQAEVRMREGPQLALQLALIARQLGSHPYARSPGGRPEVIASAPIKRVRDFYEAFYRPERAILVVVGDINPADIEKKITEKFSDWQGRGAAGNNPAPLMTQPPGEQFAINETPGMPFSQLQLQWFEPYHDEPLSEAHHREQLVEQLASATVAARLSSMLDAAGKPADSISGISSSRINAVWNGRVASATNVHDGGKTLDLMVTAYREAAQFGVTQMELDRAIALVKSQRTQAFGQGQTSPPTVQADFDVQSAVNDGSFMSTRGAFQLFNEEIATIRLEEINALLKTRFAGQPHITWSGPAAPAGGVEALKAAWTMANAKKIETYVAAADKPWPYTNFGPEGKVAERTEVADLGVTFVRFENSVRLTVRPLQGRRNDVSVSVRLGLGRLQMPRKQMDASDYSIQMWNTGGLGKLTLLEMKRTLQVDFPVVTPTVRSQDNAFVIDMGGCTGGCMTTTSLERFMQVAAALLTDPGFRTDEWANLQQRANDSDKAAFSTARAAANWHLPYETHSHDVRWAFNTEDLRKAWKPADAVAWIKPIVTNSPLEVIVVGDVKVDDVIASVGKTLGALPARKETPEPPGLRDVKFPAHTAKPLVFTHKGPADQGVAYVMWPATGLYADIKDHRRRTLLAQVITQRAVEKIRKSDGKSYAPSANAVSDPNLPGYGYIGVATDYPPAELDKAIAEIEAIAADLAANEISADEFARVVKPQIDAAQVQKKQPGFWLGNLPGAQTDPQRLEWIRTADVAYADMTPADIKAAAARWLKPDKEWTMKIVPEGMAQ